MKQAMILWALLMLLSVIRPLHAAADAKPLKLLSYNILNGMKLDESKDKAAFTAWITSTDPDILGLQEAQQLTQKGLEEMARKFGILTPCS